MKWKEKKAAKAELKRKILSGEDPYGWYDTGATSHFIAGKDEKHLEDTGQPSKKKVNMPNGQMERGGKRLKWNNGLRSPANEADSIPAIRTSLVSTSKVADAGYISVFDDEEVNVYDARTTKITTSSEPVMTGWRDKETGLWRVPLKQQINNINEDTVLLTEEETNAIITEIASNVYDLPSVSKVIRYLHACAGFPTKATWLKAIKAKYYASWPMLTERNVKKIFP